MVRTRRPSDTDNRPVIAAIKYLES
jgi:hypothetical protein